MYDIKFSPEAASDLLEIKAYIAEELCNEQAAVKTLAKITKRIRELSSFPELGTPLSSRVNLDTDYRFIVCGKYIGFYRCLEKTVYINRILYSRRDFMRILFDEPDEP